MTDAQRLELAGLLHLEKCGVITAAQRARLAVLQDLAALEKLTTVTSVVTHSP